MSSWQVLQTLTQTKEGAVPWDKEGRGGREGGESEWDNEGGRRRGRNRRERRWRRRREKQET